MVFFEVLQKALHVDLGKMFLVCLQNWQALQFGKLLEKVGTPLDMSFFFIFNILSNDND